MFKYIINTFKYLVILNIYYYPKYLKVLSEGVQPTGGGYNGEQSGYTNEYTGDDNTGEWEDQHTSYYQQDTNQSPPSYSRGMHV